MKLSAEDRKRILELLDIKEGIRKAKEKGLEYKAPTTPIEEMADEVLIFEHKVAGESMESYKKYHGGDREFYIKSYREIKKRGLTI